MKHIASIIAIPAAAFIAMAFLSGCETPADDFVSDELVEISGELITTSELEANCSFTAVAGDKKCDGRTRYKATYKGPSQPVDTGAKSKKAAAAICGQYAVDSLKPSEADSGASCPDCPNGTKGCLVSEVRSSHLNVKWNGKTYSCTGDPVRVTYECSRCKIGAGLCTDIILDGIEISDIEATEPQLLGGDTATDLDGDVPDIDKKKDASTSDADEGGGGSDADGDGYDSKKKDSNVTATDADGGTPTLSQKGDESDSDSDGKTDKTDAEISQK